MVLKELKGIMIFERINCTGIHGYHGEHNFGHGDNYLSSFLFTLNLLAFVFHTILELADPTFQNALKRRVTHKNLFQHLQSITEWMVFDSWDIVFALISIPCLLSLSPLFPFIKRPQRASGRERARRFN